MEEQSFRVSSLQQCCSALHNQILKIIKGVIHHPSCTVDSFFPPGAQEQNTKRRLNILSCQSLLYLA